ncbi:hypothetical protein BJ508DRAFT_334536 [Ascobolus immersus RN42]|uniref:Uncharacterized protein n=1 Tax=Ascobolus immersus RN42 TaxID=1160509 RepID=A0A3N4HJ24_ASCIM|nr:hypothetical protein BJ508DRAFT_334536 [Ascobolus immersus RN42]
MRPPNPLKIGYLALLSATLVAALPTSAPAKQHPIAPQTPILAPNFKDNKLQHIDLELNNAGNASVTFVDDRSSWGSESPVCFGMVLHNSTHMDSVRTGALEKRSFGDTIRKILTFCMPGDVNNPDKPRQFPYSRGNTLLQEIQEGYDASEAFSFTSGTGTTLVNRPSANQNANLNANGNGNGGNGKRSLDKRGLGTVLRKAKAAFRQDPDSLKPPMLHTPRRAKGAVINGEDAVRAMFHRPPVFYEYVKEAVKHLRNNHKFPDGRDWVFYQAPEEYPSHMYTVEEMQDAGWFELLDENGHHDGWAMWGELQEIEGDWEDDIQVFVMNPHESLDGDYNPHTLADWQNQLLSGGYEEVVLGSDGLLVDSNSESQLLLEDPKDAIAPEPSPVLNDSHLPSSEGSSAGQISSPQPGTQKVLAKRGLKDAFKKIVAFCKPEEDPPLPDFITWDSHGPNAPHWIHIRGFREINQARYEEWLKSRRRPFYIFPRSWRRTPRFKKRTGASASGS